MEYVIGSTCPNSLEAYQSYNCLGVIVIKLGNNNSRYLTTILVTYSYILQYLDFLGLLMQRVCVYIYIKALLNPRMSSWNRSVPWLFTFLGILWVLTTWECKGHSGSNIIQCSDWASVGREGKNIYMCIYIYIYIDAIITCVCVCLVSRCDFEKYPPEFDFTGIQKNKTWTRNSQKILDLTTPIQYIQYA